MKNKLVEKLKLLPPLDDDSPPQEMPPSPSTVPSPLPTPSPPESDDEDNILNNSGSKEEGNVVHSLPSRGFS